MKLNVKVNIVSPLLIHHQTKRDRLADQIVDLERRIAGKIEDRNAAADEIQSK